ncbi:MAG: Uma2 family endonuclease [Bryobacteraceae bacterium]|nr:Uma2 family endonuclease [Bryobacteraceae bacterium]
MGAAPAPKFTVEEYLRIDREAELKSEYHNGEMFPLASVSWEHAVIAANASTELSIQLRASGCTVALQPIRVRVTPSRFVYPDILIVCGRPHLTDEHVDTMTNPKVVVEVLSPSTSDFDYGGKFALYRLLPSFEEYVLISQHEQKAEIFQKAPDGTWNLRTIAGPGAALAIRSLSIEFPLADLYRGLAIT